MFHKADSSKMNFTCSLFAFFYQPFYIMLKSVNSFYDPSLPTLPKNTFSEFGRQLKMAMQNDLDYLLKESNTNEDTREVLFKNLRVVSSNLGSIGFGIRTGDFDSLDPLIQENTNILNSLTMLKGDNENSRDNRVTFMIEKFVESRLVIDFFRTGIVTAKCHLQPCNDDEYISALLGFAQELSRYCIGRATEDDFKSVQLCKRIVEELSGKMMEFNFRNGHLRRKYDGLKYCLQNIENISFELTLLHHRKESLKRKHDDIELNHEIPERSETSSVLMDVVGSTHGTCFQVPSEIDGIRQRMDEIDALREEVIKQSRDIQKMSKQAIYATHRNNLQEAETKLNKCEGILDKIMIIVNEHTELRQGSVSNCIEEYVEAVLSLHWMMHKQIRGLSGMKHVEPYEYIGALSDFTGEIGRMAVTAASKRDIQSVYEIFQADLVISAFVLPLNVNNKYGKKYDAIQVNMKKIENLMYELSLLNMSGRISRTFTLEQQQPANTNDEEEA